MKPRDESQVVVSHALKSERNLRIAAKIGLALPDLKERIIQEFIKALCRIIKRKLGSGWTIKNLWSESPLVRGSYIEAVKPAWRDRASIGLWCEKTGPSELQYFIWFQNGRRTATWTGLKQALDERYAHGGVWNHNPWYRLVDTPYRDWCSEEVLVGLWKQYGLLEYYANHLVKICRIAAPFVDKACRK